MTTAPKEQVVTAFPTAGDYDAGAEPPGAIRLSLSALGVDFRSDDFPARFIEFCVANDDYEMEINEAGELVILPMVGFRGNRQETELKSAEMTIFRRAHGGVNVSQTMPLSLGFHRRPPRPRRSVGDPGKVRRHH